MDYTCPDSFRGMVPCSSVDSIASLMTVALDNFDASDNLAAFVMDALVADIVVDSPFDSCSQNSVPDFPFDGSEALAADRTLLTGAAAVAAAAVSDAVHFLMDQAYAPNDLFAVDDNVASDQRSFLEWVQAS